MSTTAAPLLELRGVSKRFERRLDLAARVARRLGADEAMIVYRRTRSQMPAHSEEAEDAEREGVRINWLRTITAFERPPCTPSTR